MSEQFVMKAVVSIVILALGVWLLIWDRKARALQEAKQMRGSGWEGDLDEMRGGDEK